MGPGGPLASSPGLPHTGRNEATLALRRGLPGQPRLLLYCAVRTGIRPPSKIPLQSLACTGRHGICGYGILRSPRDKTWIEGTRKLRLSIDTR